MRLRVASRNPPRTTLDLEAGVRADLEAAQHGTAESSGASRPTLFATAVSRALLGRWPAGALRVLHVFPRALTFAAGDGELVALVAEESLLSPFAAVVPALFTADAGRIDRATRVVAPGPGRLELEAWCVDLTRARAWEPRPDWDSLRAPRAPAGARTAEELPGWDVPAEVAVLAGEVAPLAEALARGDVGAAAAAARALAGRGPGLTPAGDDVLVGALHAVWGRRSAAEAEALGTALAAAAAGRTTTLSAAWLRSAARGEAAVPWHGFVLARAGGDRHALARAARGVRALGASSGAAGLFGFETVWRALRAWPAPG